MNDRFARNVAAFGLLLGGSPVLAVCSDSGGSANWCTDLTSGSADVRANGAFGTSIATGDYNGDGFVDLAVGRPGGDSTEVGDVVVLLGTADLPDGSLPRDTVQFFGQGGDNFTLGVSPAMGTSLATVDLDRDLVDDLVVGVPGKDIPGNFAGCGEVSTLCLDTGVLAGYFGSIFPNIALSASPESSINTANFCGSSGDGDDNYFGASVVANQNGDVYAGAPGIGLNLDETAGYVSGFGNLFVQTDCIAAYRPATLFGEVNRTSRLGSSLAAIDKGNGNGATVVFGAPNADDGSINELGAVLVQYESNTTTNPPASVFVQQAHWPPAGDGQNDHFGAAVATGDFDGDGDDDAVVSAPDKDVGGVNDAGRLYLLRNDADQMRPVVGGLLNQNSVASCGAPEVGDRFGAALAAGYINADRFEDLVIGVPGEEAGGQSNEGIVSIIYGSAAGLTTSSTCEFFRESDVGGTSVQDANFGSVLHVADFDRDGLEEIVIGLPNRAVGGENNAGKVYIRRSVGASGMDTRINTTAFSNTVNTPIASGTSQSTVANTGTLLAGPVTHAESMVLEIDLSANGFLSNPSTPGGWRCVDATFASGRDGKRCVLVNQNLLGETTPSVGVRVNLKPGQSNGEVQWQARIRGDATETNASNNQTSGAIFFVVSDSLFGDGFE